MIPGLSKTADADRHQINPVTYGAASPAPRIVPLRSDPGDLYPRRHAVALRDIRQVDDPPGVLLSLRSDLPGIARYRYSVRGDGGLPVPEAETPDGELLLRFTAPAAPRAGRLTAEIRAVTDSGETSRPFSITVGHYPGELYEASGRTSPSWLIVQESDLILAPDAVEDWILDSPSREDRAWARRRWGGAVGDGPGGYEKAVRLAREVMADLHGRGGIPSDAMMSALPFRQLEMALSGEGGVACENHAAIYSWACNALGIPARRIGMNRPWSVRGGRVLEIAEGHHTTEIFDDRRNRWFWIDTTFGILGIGPGDQAPYTLAESVRCLNDPERREALTVREFDPAAGTERRVALSSSKARSALMKFLREDQEYRYLRKP